MEKLKTPGMEMEHSRQIPASTGPKNETPMLLKVPQEIVELICAQLCFHCQGLELPFRGPLAREERVCRRALAALSATCKTLQGFAQPVLFHRLWCPEPFRLDILRTLSSRPDLAESVKILDQSICGEVDRSFFDDPQFPVGVMVSTEDPRFVMTLVRDLGFDTEFFWQGYGRDFDSLDDDDDDDNESNYQYQDAEEDGCVYMRPFSGHYSEEEFHYKSMNKEELRQATLRDWQEVVPDDSVGDLLPEVLIALLPNLKSLVYAQGSTYASDFRLGRFEHMSDQALFEGLRTLRITNANCNLVIIDEPTRVLLESAPHLETLVISHCELPSRDDGSVEWVPEMPSLRVLQIRHNGTNQFQGFQNKGIDALRTLIEACPNLEQFGFMDYANFWERCFGDPIRNYNPTTDLIKCLAPVSRTLKRLDIDLCRQDLLFAMNKLKYDNYRESSLEGFSALESVHLSAGACSCGQLSFLDKFSSRWGVSIRPPDGHLDSIPKSESVLDLIRPISPTLKYLTIQANPESSAWGDVKELLLRMKTGEESFPKLRRVELCPTVLDPENFNVTDTRSLNQRFFADEFKLDENEFAKAPIKVEELQEFKDEFAEVLVDNVDFEIVPTILDTRRYMHI